MKAFRLAQKANQQSPLNVCFSAGLEFGQFSMTAERSLELAIF
jgi:hypothetical protein